MKKKKGTNFDNIDTVISNRTRLKGEVNGEGSLRVDGTIEGTVILTGDLVLGASGRINGNVNAQNVLVAGRVEGNMNTKGRIEISSTGIVIGDVESDILVVEEGGKIQGHCRMPVKERIETKSKNKNNH